MAKYLADSCTTGFQAWMGVFSFQRICRLNSTLNPGLDPMGVSSQRFHMTVSHVVSTSILLPKGRGRT